MRSLIVSSVAVLTLMASSGCSDLNRREQRVLTGGAIGAAAGAGIGYVAGGPVAGAALLGGVAGAAIGGLTGDDDLSLNRHRR